MAQPYDSLVLRFSQTFSQKPAFVVRVPGRVNLIGEHTDYNGLPVMPMAINREVNIAVAPRADQLIQLCNTAPDFGSRTFEIAAQIPPYETGDWGNYAKAGVQGLIDLATAQGVNMHELTGFNALVESSLPMAAGLSSSSAMVVSAALAFLASNHINVEPPVLAEQMATAERYVGTMGGGMDQAVEILAQAGAAVKIDFFPVRTMPVELPQDYSVVICNSMVVAPKTATARLNYNRRPIECRLAAQLLANHLDGRNGVPKQVQRLSELLPFVPNDELLTTAARLFGRQPWSKERAAEALGMDTAALDQAFFRMRDGQILPEFPDGLPLLDRVQHVLSEGRRVEESVATLRSGNAPAFGRLMNASHASCRDLYGISCPELEQLVGVALASGAVGARLTGAGFGGCTVNLVPVKLVDEFRTTVIAKYYDEYLQSRHPDLYRAACERGYDNVVIVSGPCQGAEIVAI